MSWDNLKARLWLVARRYVVGLPGSAIECPACRGLLQWYDDYGWLHMGDGDADCPTATLSYGKGPKRKERKRANGR